MDKIQQSYRQLCNQIHQYSHLEEMITFPSGGKRLHELTLNMGNLFLKGSEHNRILEYYLRMFEYYIERLELIQKVFRDFQQSLLDIFVFVKVPLSFLCILTNNELLVCLKHILQDLLAVYH
jgi:hypothetical protein